MTVAARDRRAAVVLAGHTGDAAAARAGLADDDPGVRAAALGALDRLGALRPDDLMAALGDADAHVRARAAELAASYPMVDLLPALLDSDDDVLEVAAWACGEHVSVSDAVLERLIDLARTADAPLVRESAVAALGTIGDPRGLPAILHGCSDKPAIRRRAVLALAPFEGPEVDAALARARTDRDWQVRQSAEDIAPAE
jgi:HEAT repeat protein